MMKPFSIGLLLLFAGFMGGHLLSKSSWQPMPAHGGNQALRETRSGPREARTTDTETKNLAIPPDAPLGALLDKAFSEQSEIRAARHLMDALSRHQKDTAPAFAAYFSSVPFSKQHFNHWRLFFSSWGTFDGPSALAYIRKHFDQAALQQEFYYSVLKSWNRGNLQDALDGAKESLLSIPGPVGEMAAEYVRHLLSSDPEKAIRQMVRLSDPEAVMGMAGEQIARLARKDALAALEMLGGVKGEEKSYLIGKTLASWSETNPSGAADWLVRQGYPMISVGDLGAIAANYVKTDVTAAFEWIHALPDSHFSAKLLNLTTTAWAKNDPAGATGWLAGHHPAAEYDPVVMAIVQTIAKDNPIAALDASTSKIHDAAKAQEVFYHIAMDWKNKQPEDFENWLRDTNQIEVEHKTRLRNREFQADVKFDINPEQVVPEVTSDGRE